MPPKKRPGSTKAKSNDKKANVSAAELETGEKLTKAGVEIEVLLRELEYNNELNGRLKSIAGEQKGKIEQLETQLESRHQDRIEITSDMSRQYKSMQADMLAKINALEASNAELRLKLNAVQSAAQESAKEHARLMAQKDELIEEQNVKMSYMSTEFESMLNETLAKMSRKLDAVSLRWKESDGMHLSEATTKRLSDFHLTQMTSRNI